MLQHIHLTLIFLFLPVSVIPACVDTELVQFPLRMRDWLKNVLLQLYEHDSMSPGFLTPKQRFRVRCNDKSGNLRPLTKAILISISISQWVIKSVSHLASLGKEKMHVFNQSQWIRAVLFCRWRKSLRVRDVCMMVITLLSCWRRTLRRTTTCTSTQCIGSLLNWTNTPLTGMFYSSVLTLNLPQSLDDTHKVLACYIVPLA